VSEALPRGPAMPWPAGPARNLPPSFDERDNSQLVSIIAVTELMRRSQQIASATFQPLEAYLIAGAIYLAINMVLAQAGRRVEAGLSVSGARA
jgi:ABC-type arginine transport system permease subunit